jgi:hypothetical protein
LYSPLGRALVAPRVTLEIERGADARQASNVWLKLANRAELPLHDVELYYTSAFVGFSNGVGVRFTVPLRLVPLIRSALIGTDEAQEFAVFENAHAFSRERQAVLVLGDPTKQTAWFVFEPDSHKPFLEQASEPFVNVPLPQRATVIVAEFELELRFRTTAWMPQKYQYRLICKPGSVDIKDVTWQMLPPKSAYRLAPPRHLHLVMVVGAEKRSGARTDGDVFNVPLNMLDLRKPVPFQLTRPGAQP